MSGTVDISHPDIATHWKAVLDDNDPTTWCLFELSPKNVLTPIATGTKGLNELHPHLDTTKVIFGGLKVLGVDDRVTTVSIRTKFIFLVLVGENVSAMRKARISVQKENIVPAFKGYSIEVYGDGPSDFTADILAKKLIASGGAHKPQYYQFGPDENEKIPLNFYDIPDTTFHKVTTN